MATKQHPTRDLSLKPRDIARIKEVVPDPKDLEFFLTWVKHGRNATQAYLELYPDVTIGSASVLGSLALGKINIQAALTAYGLGLDRYLVQLDEGLRATRRNAEIVDYTSKGKPVVSYVESPDHKTRRDYHEVLGKMLGVEKTERERNTTTVFSFTVENKETGESKTAKVEIKPADE